MIGIIGGSGVYEITSKADGVEKKIVNTDYGDVEVSILDIFSKKVAFIPRHASGHNIRLKQLLEAPMPASAWRARPFSRVLL